MTLKDMIRSRGIKANWLADRIGITKYSLSRAMNGHRPLPAAKIMALAEVLGVPFEDVFQAAYPTKGTQHNAKGETEAAIKCDDARGISGSLP
jgi:transcriptional regulator with XRE-family HTH domain